MNDLHKDEIYPSSSKRKVLVKDMSPWQLRTPVSIWKSGNWSMVLQGSINTSTLQTLFIAMSKLKVFPIKDFYIFHLYHCELFKRKK